MLRTLRLAPMSISVLLAVGCQVYDASLLERDAGGPPVDCDPIEPPSRPAGTDDGVDAGERVFIMRDVVFDQAGDLWATTGYDLDGKCTESPTYDTECMPPRAMFPQTDGENGTDNTFGRELFPLVEVTNPGLQETSRGYQERGVGAVLIRIRGWNGEPDDPRIDITAAITVFATSGAEADTEPPEVVLTPDGPQTAGGDPLPEPVWDGNDWFWARSDNFLDGNVSTPFIRDDNAYVSGGVLVLRLPDRTDFVFPGDEIGLLVRLTGAVATARIVGDGERLEDIVVAGRWPTLDLLDTAEAVGVCSGSTEHDILGRQLDRVADVRARVGTGGDGVVCDAVSLGLAFESGVIGRFAGVAEGAAVPNACAETPDAGMPDAGM